MEICRDKKKRKKRERKRSVKARTGFFEKTKLINLSQAHQEKRAQKNKARNKTAELTVDITEIQKYHNRM